ncbi:MAG: hypothetical protein FWJ90_07450 [Actinomadura sp.]
MDVTCKEFATGHLLGFRVETDAPSAVAAAALLWSAGFLAVFCPLAVYAYRRRSWSSSRASAPGTSSRAPRSWAAR